MEKVHGTPLSTLRKTAPRMDEKELVRFLHDADQALTYLHGRAPPVIHRDLKPGNVIRRTDGSYAFVDFGAVRDRLRPEGGSTVVGTFGYMAPEQFQGRAGPASDVYAIGATALALLTGKEPEELPHKGLTLDVRAALGTSVSEPLQAALVRMLEPDPDQRAARIGPLLDAAVSSRGRDGGREARRSRPPATWGDVVETAVKSSRRAARALRREAKRARREARRERRRLRGESMPFVLQLLFGVALTVAHIAVTVALHVVVPLLLTLLSVFFGKGLLRAAEAVRAAGETAGGAIDEVRADLTGGRDRAGAERLRVDTPEGAAQGPRVRVDAPPPRDATEEEDEEADDDAGDERSRRRKSGR
jgi:hypothetical protein